MKLRLPAGAHGGQAMFWRLFEAATRPTFLVTVAVLLLALFVGVATPAYVGLMGTSPGKLLALPALIMLLLFLLYDKRALLVTILLFRSICDPILESTKISVGGTALGLGLGLNLLVIVIACLFVLERPKEFPRVLANAWWPFMVLATVGFIVTPNKGEAIRVLLAAVSYFAMFIAATYMVRNKEDFRFAVKLVIWSSVLTTLYGLLDAGLHLRDGSYRLQSTFGHPNIYAFYLTLIITLLLYLLKTTVATLRPGVRVLLTGYMLLQMVLLLLTQTRSAWIGCAAIFIIYALAYERKYLLYLLLAPVVAMLIPSVRERVMDMAGGGGDEVYAYARLNSFAWRVLLWEAGLRWMEPARYLFGYGLEAFRYHSQTFFVLAGGIDWSPHNLLVQFLFDIGAVGLAAYLLTFYKMIARLRGLFQLDKVAALLFTSTIIAHVIVSMSDNVFAYLVFNWYFWFLVGGACAISPVLVRKKNYHPAVAATHHAAPADVRLGH